MKISDAIDLGIKCPPNINPDDFAWTFLESDCPRIVLKGFPDGPGAVIDARLLGGDRYLILETAVVEGLEDIYMGEIVTARVLEEGVVCLDEIHRPWRLAHYECSGFSRDSALGSLVMRLGGEWESILNGYLFFVHMPLDQATVFENACDVQITRLE